MPQRHEGTKDFICKTLCVFVFSTILLGWQKLFSRFRINSFSILFFFLFTPLFISAQVNLVPNPSFEADDNAPVITTFNWNHYTDWRKDSLYENTGNDDVSKSSVLTLGWFQPTGGTPDYLNSDQSNLLGFKTKTARTGNGRMAIITGISKNGLVSWLFYKDTYSEYIECKLNKSLESGKIYCVRYYVALDRKSNFASNHFGAMITRDQVDIKSHASIFQYEDDVHINAAEDHYITSNEGWVMVCDTFTAKGGEKYLTLGSFEGDFPKRIHAADKTQHAGLRVNPFNKFAYYYVDDVSLMEVKPDEALCEAPRDSVTRNNLVFMIDVSGSMEPKGYIAAAKNSILPLINSLPPGDHISIIAYSDNPVVLCDNVTAADTGIIRKSLENIKPGGGTNVVGAFKVAYELIRKRMVQGGTNKIVVMTDGKIYMPKSEKEKIISAKENEDITLSVIFFGDVVPKDVMKFAEEAGGDASAAKDGNADDAMRKQVPAHVTDTKYGTRNSGKIFNWEFLTKVILPGLLALLILRSTRTI
jgi:Mg-chelatase subunit ChlD